MEKNYFTELNRIDVNEHTEKKGGLTEKAISLLNDLKYAVATNAGSAALSKIAMDIYKLNENKELIN